MSIVWTEDDDKGIEGLQFLKDNGKSLPVSDSGKYSIEFEVIDHLKANNFIMDLFMGTEEEKQKVEEITGIKILNVGKSGSIEKSEIRELLIQAIEKLS